MHAMKTTELFERIRRGRTDLVFELLRAADRDGVLHGPRPNALHWFVYYGDATALRAVLAAGDTLAGIDVDEELRAAAFYGHWKVCDLLLANGADARTADPTTGETALHGALSKASRPHFVYTVRVLLDNGADVGVRTIDGRESGAFARDVRTCGETALHRAAAFADAATVELLLTRGADREARDARGDSPLSWASRHQRPGRILQLLAFGEHRIGPAHVARWTSDHGAGWGNGMEWNLMGDYLPDSASP